MEKIKTNNSSWLFLYEMVFSPLGLPVALSALVYRVAYIASCSATYNEFRQALEMDIFGTFCWFYTIIFIVIILWSYLRARHSREERKRIAEMSNQLAQISETLDKNTKVLTKLVEMVSNQQRTIRYARRYKRY